MRMRYDDGFIAYINGVQVAADREDATPNWNSLASASRSDGLNSEWEVFAINLENVDLVTGTNVLAIHGMNRSLGNSDMLILPELDVAITGGVTDTPGYFSEPSFGSANEGIAAEVAPVIKSVSDTPDRPVGGGGSAPLLITAEVSDGTGSVDEVRLYSRIMFGSENMILMNDGGTAGDETAGDGIYSALLATTSLDDGEMIRWRVEAEDDDNAVA
ncbi:hypothetical protein OAG18_02275, partial [bacterium]|nr:hypothetical protein [bacterium]